MANQGEEFELTSSSFYTPSLKRVHGGIAIIISPQDFRRLIISGIEMADGVINAADRPELVDNYLSQQQLGFVLKPEGKGLPKDMRIVVVADTYGIDKILDHEVFGEGIGLEIDQAITQNKELHEFRKIFPSKFKPETKVTLYDLAARIEQGEKVTSLGELNIPRQWAADHQDDAAFLHLIITKVSNVLSGAAIGEGIADRKQLANIIRGGTLLPENLWLFLNQGQPVSVLIPAAIRDKSNWHAEDDQVLLAKIAGRFVSNRPTLKPAHDGQPADAIELAGIKYEVVTSRSRCFIARGGQGVVYMAERVPDGEKYVIKELLFPAREALIASPDIAVTFVTGLVQQYPNRPDSILRALFQAAGMPDQSFGKIYREYIVNKLRQLGVSAIVDGAFTSKNGPPEFLIQQLKAAAAAFTEEPETEKLKHELETALQLFVAESEVLHKLGGIKGIAASLGVVLSPLTSIKDLRYHCFYMVQEFVAGNNLHEAAGIESGNRAWKFSRSVDFIRAFLSILQQAHERGVVHKDIKPRNIQVDGQGYPALLDFGIAKPQLSRLGEAERLGIRTGTTRLGTPGYAPPEQVVGHTDIRSDIFSTGMVLFSLLTGLDAETALYDRFGFDLDKIHQYMEQQLNQASVPPELQTIVLTATSSRPDDRYQTAVAMCQALDSIIVVTPNQALDNQLAQITSADFSDFDPSSNKPLPRKAQVYVNEIIEFARQDYDNVLEMFARIHQLATFDWHNNELTGWVFKELILRTGNIVKHYLLTEDVALFRPVWFDSIQHLLNEIRLRYQEDFISCRSVFKYYLELLGKTVELRPDLADKVMQCFKEQYCSPSELCLEEKETVAERAVLTISQIHKEQKRVDLAWLDIAETHLASNQFPGWISQLSNAGFAYFSLIRKLVQDPAYTTAVIGRLQKLQANLPKFKNKNVALACVRPIQSILEEYQPQQVVTPEA
ncbi:protein kinase [Patescibacteria group bacterium]|nr:protein kinase [Patescibacteria group bacterium]MBU1931240.1 protein kinase [Patescibacteria group bacterium]